VVVAGLGQASFYHASPELWFTLLLLLPRTSSAQYQTAIRRAHQSLAVD